MTLMRLRLSEAVGETTSEIPPQQMSVRSAREALWQALAEGKIAASAISQATGRPLEIPALEWPYIEHTGSNDLEDQLRFTGAGHAEYGTLTFRRADVLHLWPHGKGEDQADSTALAGDSPASSSGPAPAIANRAVKPTPKLDLAKKLVERAYPNGFTPANKTVEIIRLAQRQHRKEDGARPSDDVIKRAIGRKKG